MRRKLTKSLIVLGCLIFFVGCSAKSKTTFNDNIQYEEQKVAIIKEEKKEINILSLGSFIIHGAQLEGALKEDGYNFSPSFEYVKDIYSEADETLAILETTFSGGMPTGYPWFNSPDELLSNMKDTGIDTINYANNHINDGLDKGFDRTIEMTKKVDLGILGIKENLEDKNYLVKDFDGRKIGFISYVFETAPSNGSKTINGNSLLGTTSNRINSFNYGNLEEFYANIEQEIADMKNDGARFIIVGMHWGEEYNTYPEEYQTEIAKHLSDLGVNIILGGHPHVIQPFEIIKGDNGNETFVIYSQGNALSNQSESEVGVAETEDGIMINFTIGEKEDKLYLKEYKIIPTWVYKEPIENGIYSHKIIPVEDALNNPSKYNFTDDILNRVKISLERTKTILKQ